jgi:hypothetical protein
MTNPTTTTTERAPRVRHPRLTPPQLELLTDIATYPQMYLRHWSRWEKTGHVLERHGLAVFTRGGEPTHSEIRITDDGCAEAVRRKLVVATFIKGVRCGGCGERLPDQEIARDCFCARLDAIECWCPDAFLDSGQAIDECPKHGTHAVDNAAAAEQRPPHYGQPKTSP